MATSWGAIGGNMEYRIPYLMDPRIVSLRHVGVAILMYLIDRVGGTFDLDEIARRLSGQQADQARIGLR